MTSLISTLNEWGGAFCHHAFWMLIQTGVLVAVLWTLDVLLRRHVKASIRYGIWMLVLTKLVLPVDFKLPSGVGYWLHWQTPKNFSAMQLARIDIPQPPVVYENSARPESIAADLTPAVSEKNVPVVSAIENSSQIATTSVPTLSIQGWILAIWMAGAGCLFVGLLIQFVMVRAMIGRSQAVGEFTAQLLRRCGSALGITRRVYIRQSDEISGPAVCGLFHPTILIPSTLLNKLEKEQLETVLLHELVHIQRYDLWVNFIQTILQVFYFYNPFVRLANHCIRRTREQANDEHVLVRLDGRRDHYSATLVEVAAAGVGRPMFAVRLIGVAEPHNQLHERITLMMRKAIPTNAKMGFAGFLVLILLAAVLLPMAAGPKAFAEETPKGTLTPVLSGVAPITQEQFLAGSQNVLNQLLGGWSSADAAGIAVPYTQDCMALNPGEGLVIGKAAVTSLFTKALGEGTRILSANTSYRSVWVSGKYVFSVDKMASTLRVASAKQLLLAFIKNLTVWEIQPDGSLKIKVDSWNLDKLPDGGPFITEGISIEKDGFHCPVNNVRVADASSETLDKIRRLEKEFHTFFLAKNVDAIASSYATEAILLPNEDDFIRGREQIKAHTAGNLRRLDVQSVGDKIICIEGTEEMVFVVNTYDIKAKDTMQGGETMDIPCKGVHIWQKQPDGSWKILMDSFNANFE